MSMIYKEGQYYGKGGTEMPAEDMAEVASPLPSVMSRLPILFDESGAERIVGWYKYADGTKKPLYEKSWKTTTPATLSDKTWTNVSGVVVNNAEYLTVQDEYVIAETGEHLILSYGDYVLQKFINGQYQLYPNGSSWLGNKEIYIVARYTKTTDTPV